MLYPVMWSIDRQRLSFMLLQLSSYWRELSFSPVMAYSRYRSICAWQHSRFMLQDSAKLLGKMTVALWHPRHLWGLLLLTCTLRLQIRAGAISSTSRSNGC